MSMVMLLPLVDGYAVTICIWLVYGYAVTINLLVYAVTISLWLYCDQPTIVTVTIILLLCHHLWHIITGILS